SCAKEDSIASSSTAKPGNPPPCRAIEKFPREQFEAFVAFLKKLSSCVPTTTRVRRVCNRANLSDYEDRH
ncbi:MAG TPA: hypothetical protein VM656_15125, partial [Pyrinomonadaceae bacterium]|nr:hypothetical protein [Pyrinomonadaceae bacterium]